MKKKINILGRKVPVLAVIMVLLVIGTASAALIDHYATLSGDVTVAETISVTGNGDPIPNGEIGSITFTDEMATFTIDNDGDGTSVNLVTTLFLDESAEAITDTEGITITYVVNADPLQTYELTGDAGILPQVITVEPGFNTVTVTFGADPALETGLYTIQVAVDPYTASE